MQLQLTPLAGYSVPCGTIPMAASCATAAGNIFLGGTDGNVYQVQYGKRQACRLACVSRSFLSMLGAGVLPGYLSKRIWNTVPIRLMVVDDDRHFLYTLAENHMIRVRFQQHEFSLYSTNRRKHVPLALAPSRLFPFQPVRLIQQMLVFPRVNSFLPDRCTLRTGIAQCPPVFLHHVPCCKLAPHNTLELLDAQVQGIADEHSRL